MRPMPDIQPPEHIHEFPLAVVKNMLALAASGFGLVVALAWNAFIQKLVSDYIAPYLGKNSGILSMFIYAVVVTVLAVFATMHLTNLQRRLENFKKKVPTKPTKRKKKK